MKLVLTVILSLGIWSATQATDELDDPSHNLACISIQSDVIFNKGYDSLSSALKASVDVCCKLEGQPWEDRPSFVHIFNIKRGLKVAHVHCP